MSEIKVTRKYWDDMAETYGSDVAQGMLGDRPCQSPCGHCNECPPSKRPIKQEWEGGLPPVGVECEFIHPGITSEGWQVGTIKAYFDDRVAIKSNPSIWPACGYAVILIDDELKFRPLKSKQERQRDELKAFLSDTVCSSNGMNKRQIMEDLTDAILSKYNLEPKP